jgi:hypothetical protein
MAGFGMARYHKRVREHGWRYKRAINIAAGALSGVVVAVFAVVKFTEGAWLVVVLFPILWFAFIRLNREYTMEAEVLERVESRPKPPEQPNYSRRTVYLLVDSFDLATMAAVRYARSLRPTTLHAVHFVIDTDQANQLREEWMRGERDIVIDFIDTPDRRLIKAAAELISREAAVPGTHVTAVLPRRTYSPLLGRLLHDHTADKIAAAVSQIPHAAATIVPFDVRSRLQVLHERQVERERQLAGQAPGANRPDGAAGADARPPVLAASSPSPPRNPLRRRRAPQPDGQGGGPDRGSRTENDLDTNDRRASLPGVNPISSLTKPGRVTAEGRVRAVEIRPVERNSVLAIEISDATGDLTALFYGRSHIPGVICGSRVRLRGVVGIRHGRPVMINPAYELLAAGEASPPTGGEG